MKHSRAKDALKGMIEIAERRVDEARTIGWPALAASWGQDLARLREELRQRDKLPKTKGKQ